ncbi:hypothetical protein BS78_01G112300 [Paspalum vaginatum]|nr:hypothetical protein BS78_01G112300 [Paspalum vaginatum]
MTTIQQHHFKALTPTWFIGKVTLAPALREGGKKAGAASHSPLLLSPAVWQKAQDEKRKRRKGKDDAERAGGLPASPRISCMGQVKGMNRGCSSGRAGPAPAPRGSRCRGTRSRVATLVLGLFGGLNARTSRACAKVRDVPASAPGTGSSRGARASATVAVGVFDPPLPVVRRPPATDDNAPSLWERRRGGRALEGLQLA